MMFMTTPHQDYILTLLKKTRFMRTDQVFKLLVKIDKVMTVEYTRRLLNQLKHIQKISWRTDTVFTLPMLYNESVDEVMLAAIDIMLDLTDYKVLALSGNRGAYKLCFFTEQKCGAGSYAVIAVPLDSEQGITAALYDTDSENRTIIFLLSALSQKGKIKTALPHFFAVKDNGRYRYFRGGD